MPATFRRRRARAPQLERETSLVPIAAARQVIEALSLWLGVPLHGRYARRLAFQARRCYAHSDSSRAKLHRPGDRGRDALYFFMQHWLAARLQTERPDLYARLPSDYACGADLPAPPPRRAEPVATAPTGPATRHGFDTWWQAAS